MILGLGGTGEGGVGVLRKVQGKGCKSGEWRVGRSSKLQRMNIVEIISGSAYIEFIFDAITFLRSKLHNFCVNFMCDYEAAELS